MRIADIGCGTGNVYQWLAGQVGSGGLVIGVDTSTAQLEQARQSTGKLGLDNVKFT